MLVRRNCYVLDAMSSFLLIPVAKPFTFSGTSFVMFKLKESYRRKLLLAKDSNPGRRRKSTANTLPETNSFSVEFRTRNANGILLFAEDIGGNFTVLHVSFLFFIFILFFYSFLFMSHSTI